MVKSFPDLEISFDLSIDVSEWIYLISFLFSLGVLFVTKFWLVLLDIELLLLCKFGFSTPVVSVLLITSFLDILLSELIVVESLIFLEIIVGDFLLLIDGDIMLFTDGDLLLSLEAKLSFYTFNNLLGD